ncbi:hypothetical protein [Bartonella sp. CB60]|uniref:hypothetical protein n=1 Tax=Bartonella sp. CB60 TaxID=3113619 RepID=UPI00300DF334
MMSENDDGDKDLSSFSSEQLDAILSSIKKKLAQNDSKDETDFKNFCVYDKLTEKEILYFLSKRLKEISSKSTQNFPEDKKALKDLGEHVVKYKVTENDIFSLRNSVLSESYKFTALAIVLEAVLVPAVKELMNFVCKYCDWDRCDGNLCCDELAVIVIQIVFISLSLFCGFKCVTKEKYFEKWKILQKKRGGVLYLLTELRRVN